jgi:hypothetical protein
MKGPGWPLVFLLAAGPASWGQQTVREAALQGVLREVVRAQGVKGIQACVIGTWHSSCTP